MIEEQKRQEKSELKEAIQTQSKNIYDPLKREPKYCNAKDSALWELVCLSNHCHPTIRDWAEMLAQGRFIKYTGDPLLDLGLANFLDRVSYKNPKVGEKAQKFR